MAETIPVLLDTDIGSDIDDALCLAYLLKQPRCELLGITTNTGNTVQRAALAEFLCRRAGREDVPIHAGPHGPLLHGAGQRAVPQYDALRGKPHRTDFPVGGAIEFMRNVIRSRRREVTLLAIGPMTNVALLFATDPEIPSLLRELVLMCGVFTWRNNHGPGSREYNAMTDPLATAMVYRARPRRFLSVGLDVTRSCRLAGEECRRRFAKAGGPLEFVAAMAEIWFRQTPDAAIPFHDPLAGALIFRPDLCEYQDGEVTVEAASAGLAGMTVWNARCESNPHTVAVNVNAPAFFEHYFAVVGG